MALMAAVTNHPIPSLPIPLVGCLVSSSPLRDPRPTVTTLSPRRTAGCKFMVIVGMGSINSPAGKEQYQLCKSCEAMTAA